MLNGRCKSIFFKYYRPVNAILAVGGNVTVEQVKALAEKWFGDIPSGEKYHRNLPVEPAQTAAHKLEVKANVPLDALYKCYRMYAHRQTLLRGGSHLRYPWRWQLSRLNQVLVKEKKLFSNIECYHFGSLDAGLLTIEGKLVKGVKMKDAEKAIQQELEKLQQEVISERELQKVKNRVESLLAFEDMSLLQPRQQPGIL